MDLPDAVFGAKVNPNLLHETVRWYQATQRAGTHKTKGRGEVSGAGRKLWKQKGTGRARVDRFAARSGARRHSAAGAAQLRVPLTEENAPRRSRSALSAKFAEPEIDRGGDVAARFAQDQAVPPGAHPFWMGTEDGFAGGNVGNRNLELASRNLEGVKLVAPHALQPYDLLRHDHWCCRKRRPCAWERRWPSNGGASF